MLTNGGTLELRKPTAADSPYILTTMTKEELIQYIKSSASVYKVIAGIFGVTGQLKTNISLYNVCRNY